MALSDRFAQLEVEEPKNGRKEVSGVTVSMTLTQDVVTDAILQTTNDASSHTRPPILKLPAELRNKTWQLALREEGKIQVWSRRSVRLPNWIRASKQVFEETFRLWFATNDFRVMIVDLDRTPLEEFLDDLDKIRAGVGSMEISVGASRNWENLVSWCEAAYWKYRALAMGYHGMAVAGQQRMIVPILYDEQETKDVVEPARAISKKLVGVPWGLLLVVLEDYRVCAALKDPEWLM